MGRYVGKYSRVGYPNKRELVWEATEDASAAKSRIKALYNDRAPIFTMASLRELHQQLKSDLQPGQKISVRGLDGVIVEFDVEIGRVVDFRSDKPDVERVAVQLGITYISPVFLLRDPYDNHLAYSPMIIHHFTTLRHKVTKEPIEAIPSSGSDVVKAEFTEGLEQWESSKTCLDLQATVKKIKFPCGFKIDKIIAFACELCRKRSLYQHGLIRTLRKALSNLEGCQDIRCLAQDPAYTSIDIEVLEAFEISTLDDPEGFLQIDDTTLVVSMMPDVPVKEIVADIARPAMIVWDMNPNGPIYCTDPTSSRVTEYLDKSYSKSEFPVDTDTDTFRGVAIYTRLDT
ncbi:hypothetical protein FQN49_001714 [Arthroderma sp. PD_2]|nr:hypothetical protein FQN49_001714 [Arthroderma sp. PD_2]